MFDNIRTPFPGHGAHPMALGPGKAHEAQEATGGLPAARRWGLSRDVGGRGW